MVIMFKTLKVSQTFVETIVRLWGPKGSLWLSKLPVLIERYSQKWQLSNLCPFEHLSYHYVLRAWSGFYQKEVVLKLGLPGDLREERAALTFFNGHGSVVLLDWEEGVDALLIECLQPGTSLKSFFPDNDAQAVRIAVEVMNTLHRKASAKKDFVSVTHIVSEFENGVFSEIPYRFLQKARSLAKRLASGQQELYLLHGDLHHENILFDERRLWTAIDPKGVVGGRIV